MEAVLIQRRRYKLELMSEDLMEMIRKAYPKLPLDIGLIDIDVTDNGQINLIFEED